LFYSSVFHGGNPQFQILLISFVKFSIAVAVGFEEIKEKY